MNGEGVNVTTKDSGGWRELLSGAGVRSVSVSAAGIFTGSDAELRLRGHALAGTIDDYELSFESGERMRGRFLVTRLDYLGGADNHIGRARARRRAVVYAMDDSRQRIVACQQVERAGAPPARPP